MTENDAQQSDKRKKIVMSIIAIAIIATIIALAWYFFIELPIQQAALNVSTNPPTNMK